eukprot:229224-Chlamydomonas_euryale.AAC.6
MHAVPHASQRARDAHAAPRVCQRAWDAHAAPRASRAPECAPKPHTLMNQEKGGGHEAVHNAAACSARSSIHTSSQRSAPASGQSSMQAATPYKPLLDISSWRPLHASSRRMQAGQRMQTSWGLQWGSQPYHPSLSTSTLCRLPGSTVHAFSMSF